MKKSKALVHIPKTGGTTFARTLKWIYEPWRCFRYNPEDPSRTCKLADKLNDKYFNNFVLMSHSYFGIHKYVKKDIDYITIIRNPIRRYISRYYHLKIHYPESKGASMKLEEFCKSSHGWSKGNRLVSYISGMDAETNFTSALSKAKENLERNFRTFGLTEKFDASLLLFQRRLNWSRPPFYLSRMRSHSRPRLEDISSDVVSRIESMNRLDIKLYHFARDIFEDNLNKEFENLSEKIRHFRNKNRLFQKCASPIVQLYNKLKYSRFQ